MYYDYLERQKKYILRERRMVIILLSILWLPFGTLLCMVLIDKNIRGILLISALLLPITMFFLFDIYKQNQLLKQFSQIEEKQRINKTYQLSLYRPKVGFLVKTKLSRYAHHAVEYYGLVLTDYQKNKYYYFFGEHICYDKETVKRIQEKLYRELHLQCYEGTRIIKMLENDPYFLKVKFGKLYE